MDEKKSNESIDFFRNVSLLFANLYIYFNYEKLVEEFNTEKRTYIRVPKSIYWNRIINLLYSLEPSFKDRSMEEIKQFFFQNLDLL